MDWNKFEKDIDNSTKGKVSLVAVLLWVLIFIGLIFFTFKSATNSNTTKKTKTQINTNK
jgi:hypothetical protein